LIRSPIRLVAATSLIGHKAGTDEHECMCAIIAVVHCGRKGLMHVQAGARKDRGVEPTLERPPSARGNDDQPGPSA
jgi:hypothetical protein